MSLHAVRVVTGIPDIRLFWTSDSRFHSQFSADKLRKGGVKFQPYSSLPACYKDISYWLPAGRGASGTGGVPTPRGLVTEARALLHCFAVADFHEHDFFCVVRDVAGDLVEKVQLIDSFQKGTRTSHCYRVMYRSMDRSLTNEEVDVLQNRVRQEVVDKLGVELR